MKLKVKDEVIMLSGREKGQKGSIETILPRSSKVVVAGLNIAKRHTKPSNKFPRGGIREITMPIPAGKVALVCPSCKKPTRVGYLVKKDHKERICKKCQAVIK